MQVLLLCDIICDCCTWYDECGTEHGLGEHDDNTLELHENEGYKYNNRDDSTIAVATGRRACMPRGSHDPATEEQPYQNNGAGGVNNIPGTMPFYY